MTITQTPAATYWITVALIPNDIANCSTTSITCGTIPLTQLDPGYTADGISYIPEVWGAPFQTGMSTTITVNWSNSSAPTSTTMYAVALGWSGAASTPTANYANFRTNVSGGLIDGASGTQPIGGAATNGAVDSAGVINLNNPIVDTSYDAQFQPYVLAVIMRGSQIINNTTTVLSGVGASVVNGVLTSSGAPSGTLYVNVAGTNALVSGTIAIVGSGGGNVPFSYTSSSPGTLSGCTVPSASDFYTSTTIPVNAITTYIAGSGSNILLSNAPTLSACGKGGFSSGTVYQISTTGGTLGNGRLAFTGGASTGLTSTSAYVLLRASRGGNGTGGAVLLTFVPATRKLTRTSSTTLSRTVQTIKTAIFRRRPTATQPVAATVIRTKTLKKGIRVSASYAIGVSKKSTFTRRAIASTSMSAQVVKLKGKNFLIVSNATWNMAKSGTIKLLIQSQTLVSSLVGAVSSDWQRPNNGQPVPGTGPEIFDDVPETINDANQTLGTDTVPFHD